MILFNFLLSEHSIMRNTLQKHHNDNYSIIKRATMFSLSLSIYIFVALVSCVINKLKEKHVHIIFNNIHI